jgi:hypothetical protein
MNQQNRLILILLCLSLFPINSFSQTKTRFEPNYIVELQTAGCYEKGTYAIQFNSFTNGGVRFTFGVSPFNNFVLGVSYGGSNIIGTGNTTFQSLPGVILKFRFLDEKISFPALAIGVNTQGYGHYYRDTERFETYSTGVFLVASKSFTNPIGFFDIHFGVNYSFEPKPKERTPNFYFGFSQEVLQLLSLNFEYNATLEEHTNRYLSKKGIFSASLNFLLTKNITAGIIFKDLLVHLQGRTGIERNFVLHYVNYF